VVVGMIPLVFAAAFFAGVVSIVKLLSDDLAESQMIFFCIFLPYSSNLVCKCND
jgi:hypothetical protein